MSDLGAVLDALDLAIAHAPSALDEEQLVAPASAAARLRERRGFLGGTFVLALAGGTGVGKSSLLNAMADRQVASVSALRPHTTDPLAWVPEGAEPGFYGLLDRYGIVRRVHQTRFPGLAIIDLPDHDSVVPEHRAVVARMVTEVDAVAWLLDPEKYRDRALHEQFLKPLTDYQEQFVFVLNQIDRLGDQTEIVAKDLADTLRANGIANPRIFALAAAPPSTSPIGMEPIMEFLDAQLETKRSTMRKIAADVRRTAKYLVDRAGLERGGSIGFRERWPETRAAAAVAVLRDSTRGSYSEALAILETFMASISVETGGTFARRIRDEMTPAAIAGALDSGIELELANHTDPPRRRRAKRLHAAERRRLIEGELEARLGVPVRDMLWGRATLAAQLATLGVELANVERRLDL